MARGTNSGDSNLQLFFMKITGLMIDKGEKIHIKQTQAVEKGKHIELEDTVPDVSGQLHKVEVREYEPRAGEKARELKVWLKDEKAKEMYAVSCNMNSIGRSILNTILNITAPYGELMIRVYNKKDTGYPAAFVTHNGAKVGWKYSIDEQNKHITETPVKKNGVTKIEKDYWELDTILIADLNENVAPNLSKVPTQFQDAPQTEQAPPDTLIPEDVGDGSDDLPF